MQVMPEHRCVVVGVDGSPNSVAALRRSAREALRRHARLDVVRVLEPAVGRTPRLLRTAREWLRLRDLVARTVPRSQHLTTRLRIVHGSAGDALAEAAEHAELLVLGAGGGFEHGDLFGGDTVPVARDRARCQIVICADQTGDGAAS
ncbi:universal stress protein [Actinomadura graeca]|uniref:Universal stress protein n=1 Tax=Actinomadura graeca TaxID=2750812 RepID=A0ABX8QV40_9ACTN|nr:universal stress protein [Actinomadura graeca]QXJ22640.1 universal stress protein [Actinomadura graeca]